MSSANVSAEQLKLFIERIETLEEEKRGIADDIKDVYAEAKANGYDVKTMRAIVRLRKMDNNARAEMEALLETRNNARYGEFGTLCVYPPYAASARLVEKSAYPLRYHNGADWPYLSALYAFAKKLYGMDYRYPLTRWFTVGLEQGFATPVEYYSPYYPAGGMLQGWSAFAAVVLERENADGIFR